MSNLSPSPQQRLEALRAAQDAGAPVTLMPFFGHRGRPGTVGPWVLSQWWQQPFTVEDVEYLHGEMFMMAAKARLFGDGAALERILASQHPKDAKALGRSVAGFDQATWDAHAYRIVVEGNLAKFSQNPDLRAYLAATAPAVLVEASPYDRIWGIGLSKETPGSHLVRNWRGRNLLGFALTHVREVLERP